MDGCYEVRLGSQSVGQAQVRQVGLYYEFSCRCVLSGEVICRLTVTCGEKTENLGIPVPQGREFVLKTRIPVKRLGQGTMEIRVVPRHTALSENFIPLSPEEPFRYLTRLQDAYLVKTAQGLGIGFRAEM